MYVEKWTSNNFKKEEKNSPILLDWALPERRYKVAHLRRNGSLERDLIAMMNSSLKQTFILITSKGIYLFGGGPQKMKCILSIIQNVTDFFTCKYI